MNKTKYITIRITHNTKQQLENLKHSLSISQNKNVTISETIEYLLSLNN